MRWLGYITRLIAAAREVKAEAEVLRHLATLDPVRRQQLLDDRDRLEAWFKDQQARQINRHDDPQPR